MRDPLVIGATKYMKAGGVVVFARYGNGDTAIKIEGPNGEPWAKATVCLEGITGYVKPPRDEVWLKGWDENAGLPRALEDAGVLCRVPGVRAPTGFVYAEYAQLTPLAIAALDAAEAEGAEGEG